MSGDAHALGDPALIRGADDPTACTFFELLMLRLGLSDVLVWLVGDRYVLLIDCIQDDWDEYTMMVAVASRGVVEDAEYSVEDGE